MKFVFPTFGRDLLFDGGLPEAVGGADEVVQLGLLLLQLSQHILQPHS